MSVTFEGKYFVTGKSLPHTMSPDIYTRLGLDYGVKEFPTAEDFLLWVSGKDYDGFNVTIPYKETVMPLLDYVSPEAQEIGAVNTVVKRDGKLYGYNTDCYGMARAIKENGIEVSGKVVAVLGSGGTSKCAVYVLKNLGAKEVKVCSRSGAYNYEKLYADSSIKVIVNTTPIGMFPHVDESVVDLDKLSAVDSVYDVIYNPLTTLLVQKAKDKGLKCGNGLSMLVYQGVKAYELYTDTKLTEVETQKLYNDIYASKKNVVLVGMPGAGKTTLGKAIASAMNKEFFDSDEEFVSTFGVTPKEVILERGESVFRDMESEVIKTLSSKLGVVIATGGGAVLREENRRNLKANSTVIFIDRDLDLLTTEGRPLSEKEGVQTLYKKRLPIYQEIAHFTISSGKDATIEETIKSILDILNA